MPTLLRPGALPLRALRDVTGAIAVRDEETADGAARPSPGMSRRHYAPRAKTLLMRDLREADRAGLTAPSAILTYEGVGYPPYDIVEVLSADPREFAADLYAALHRLDDAGVATILIQEPPDGEDWLAVRDRLARAAA